MRKLTLVVAFVLVAIPGCGSAAAMHSQSTTTAASVDRSQHVQRSIDADTNLTVGLNGLPARLLLAPGVLEPAELFTARVREPPEPAIEVSTDVMALVLLFNDQPLALGIT
jgi:hypothetical protein